MAFVLRVQNGTEFRCLITISETFVNGEHLFTAVIRDLSNELLLQNMMPPSIAARLRAKETINDKHDNVSILFAGPNLSAVCPNAILTKILTAC